MKTSTFKTYSQGAVRYAVQLFNKYHDAYIEQSIPSTSFGYYSLSLYSRFNRKHYAILNNYGIMFKTFSDIEAYEKI